MSRVSAIELQPVVATEGSTKHSRHPKAGQQRIQDVWTFLTVQAAALKQRLVGILTSAAAQKIDHVDRFGYNSVVNELRNGSIGIRLGQAPAGAAAAYRTKEKLFDFPNRTYGFLPTDQGAMVHEATYAMKALLYPFKAGMMEADT
jgi:hypothetical protein